MFRVLILRARPSEGDNVVYQGDCESVLLPGADGEFEILDFHKPIISRLKKGTILVDNFKEIPVRGGVAKMDRQSLVAMVDI
jgi:F-type H+-transporting ATPase subunit epsilon